MHAPRQYTAAFIEMPSEQGVSQKRRHAHAMAASLRVPLQATHVAVAMHGMSDLKETCPQAVPHRCHVERCSHACMAHMQRYTRVSTGIACCGVLTLRSSVRPPHMVLSNGVQASRHHAVHRPTT